MPVYFRQAPPRNGLRHGQRESTDNLEPLIEQSDVEDTIQVAETPDYGLSVEALSLHYEPTDPPSPTAPTVREIRIAALDAPNVPYSKGESLETKGVGALSVAVRELEQEQSSSQPSQPERSRLVRIRDSIYGHFHPQAVLHLLDFRPWFWPFTWKKYFVIFVITSIIAGIIVSDHYTQWIATSLEITRSYMLPVLVISVCAEPLIILIILPVARLPDISKDQIDLVMGREGDVEGGINEKFRVRQGPFETALVIPCHNTDHTAMRTTIESALPHFRPKDIFIIDNGRSKYPSHPDGNFREYIRSIHPDIVYVWSPIGSKNAAQLVGALAARERGYRYIMTVDDDVCIPKNFDPPTDMIDDKFKAVAFPIKAMDAQCNVPLWLVAWQDVEYRLSGMSKLAEDRLCGVQFPHGAGWFVELDSFITLMEYYHPMDFIAEDCNAGLGLSRMGKGIRLDARCYLATEVPTTFFGPGLNWWKQRQKSWEMGRHGRLFVFIRHFFLSMPPKRTIQGVLWHKLTFFYLICTIIIDWLRIPTIIALGRTATWWRNAILLMLFSVIPPMIYNYWKCRRRPDMKVRFWACFTYPWYKQIYVVVAICGAIRWAGFFLGGHQVPPTIQQMLRRKDERCFWLDPRFKGNPAWLADEAEALEAERLRANAQSNLMETTEVSPPTATYFSATMSSVDYDLPQPHNSKALPQPRGSPDLDAMDGLSTLPSGPPSPLVITAPSTPSRLVFETNPFEDPDLVCSEPFENEALRDEWAFPG
ncbi:hypothetical protein E8E12_004813 [Didymella heteroderae]|uniref:Transferase n=1 Tax=Didymella heteroderae TaxID=1769908 RepID=A0A9P5BXL9_9PLEO|nr:hypothetical protein E8E12_004813 [Didymella heteroderae]